MDDVVDAVAGEPKIDLKATVPGYRPGRNHVIELIELPPQRYLMIDGHGDPNTSALFGEALALLYPVAYKAKFASKRELGRDYVVPPLEGLWWADDMDSFTSRRDKAAWYWTLMSLVPDWVTLELLQPAIAAVPGTEGRVRVETLDEGLCAQTLHVGSFDDEAAILQQLHERFVPEHGLRMRGRHHEVYLSDRRRVAPERLRTILRQPVSRGPGS